MQNTVRRSFLKTTLAGALVAAASLHRAALAAPDSAELKDVKFPKDPASLLPGLESAHTPALTLEKLDSASVAFGKTPAGEFYRVNVQAKHEATSAHHIFGIALYLNGALLAEHAMSQSLAEAALPVGSFVLRLKAGDELLAVTTCNVHGKWGRRAVV